MSEKEKQELDLALDEAFRLAGRQMCHDHGESLKLIIEALRKVIWRMGHAKGQGGAE